MLWHTRIAYNFSQPFPDSEPAPAGKTAQTNATVINAKFSSRRFPAVHMFGDSLLTDCWHKACSFARNFNALYVDIEHLLLGASQLREAEAALSAACDDVEKLNHDLAGLCARRSFAPGPGDNSGYEASQALKAILCEAAALAARKGMSSLTLSVVIEALAESKPRPTVLDVLPKLRRLEDAEEAKMRFLREMDHKVGSVAALVHTGLSANAAADAKVVQLDARVANIDAKVERLHALLNSNVSTRLATLEQITSESHGQIITLSRQHYAETHLLSDMLVDQPQIDPLNPAIPGQPVLRVATAQQIRSAAAEQVRVVEQLHTTVAAIMSSVNELKRDLSTLATQRNEAIAPQAPQPVPQTEAERGHSISHALRNWFCFW